MENLLKIRNILLKNKNTNERFISHFIAYINKLNDNSQWLDWYDSLQCFNWEFNLYLD